LNAYISIFKLRFAVQLQYRAAAMAGLFTQFFFGFVRVMVFQAFYASSTLVQPLTLEQAVTYTWITQATFRMQPYNTDVEVIDMIRSGNVAYELCRPLSLYFFWYCRLITFRLVPALLAGIPMIIIAYLLPADYGMSFPASLSAGIIWIISTLLALLLGCAISNLISISALWTISGIGMQRIFPVVATVLSGLYVPLAFFPDKMQTILRFLPFSGLVDIPIRFYLGLIPASELITLGSLQLLWTLVLVFIGIRLLSLGTKRVVIQGG
jgi:ABC-2 type transport system permease protein